MDKETLSNYGWIVICVLVLAVMIALATPFGNFVADAVKSTAQGLFDVNQNALNSTGLITIDGQEFKEDNSITKKQVNIFDSSKYLGNKKVNANNGEISEDETFHTYGPFNIEVGETYTFSKDTGVFWIYFYNEDGSYAGNAHTVTLGANKESETFTAEYPICYVMSHEHQVSSDNGVKFVKGDSVPADEGTEGFF